MLTLILTLSLRWLPAPTPVADGNPSWVREVSDAERYDCLDDE